jgi:hypothetical protein
MTNKYLEKVAGLISSIVGGNFAANSHKEKNDKIGSIVTGVVAGNVGTDLGTKTGLKIVDKFKSPPSKIGVMVGLRLGGAAAAGHLAGKGYHKMKEGLRSGFSKKVDKND